MQKFKIPKSYKPLTFWVLFRGNTQPPVGKPWKTSNSSTSDESDYLEGLSVDFTMMKGKLSGVDVKEDKDEQKFPKKCDRLIFGDEDNDFTTSQAKKTIEAVCEAVAAERSGNGKKHSITIYYGGHGEEYKGNWCFQDGVLKLEEIVNIFKKYKEDVERLLMVADCCFAGNWVVKLGGYDDDEYGKIWMQAPWPGQVAKGSSAGGNLTRHLYYETDDEMEHCIGNCFGMQYAKGKPVYEEDILLK